MGGPIATPGKALILAAPGHSDRASASEIYFSSDDLVQTFLKPIP